MAPDPNSPPSKPRPAHTTRAAFGLDAAGYDEDIYGAGPAVDRYAGFAREVVEPGDDAPPPDLSQLRRPAAEPITAPQQYLDEASAPAHPHPQKMSPAAAARQHRGAG
jgi:hypothetical protein